MKFFFSANASPLTKIELSLNDQETSYVHIYH